MRSASSAPWRRRRPRRRWRRRRGRAGRARAAPAPAGGPRRRGARARRRRPPASPRSGRAGRRPGGRPAPSRKGRPKRAAASSHPRRAATASGTSSVEVVDVAEDPARAGRLLGAGRLGLEHRDAGAAVLGGEGGRQADDPRADDQEVRAARARSAAEGRGPRRAVHRLQPRRLDRLRPPLREDRPPLQDLPRAGCGACWRRSRGSCGGPASRPRRPRPTRAGSRWRRSSCRANTKESSSQA